MKRDLGGKEKGKNCYPVIVAQFGPPSLACIRSWGRQGFPVGLVCIRSSCEGKPDSKYLTAWISLSSKELYTDGGIFRIVEFIKKIRATAVTCINEKIGCWIKENECKIPTSVSVCLGSPKIVRKVLSKKEQIDVAQRVGMNVLNTYYIDKKEFPVDYIPLINYPICLRPSEPGGVVPSLKAIIINTPDKLHRYLQNINRIIYPIVAQPYKKMPNLVIHGARTINGKSIGIAGFLVENKFEGVTLTFRPVALPPEIRQRCIDFVNAFDLVGNYHFEILWDPETMENYFLEINHRFGGTTAKAFACSYDEPAFALQAYGLEAMANSKINNVTVSSKLALIKFLFYAISKRLTPLDYPDVARNERIRKAIVYILSTKDEVLSFQDFRGTISFFLGNFKRSVLNIVRHT